jgi:hypothetical protein
MLVCMCFIATRNILGFYISVVHSFQAKRPKRGVTIVYVALPSVRRRGKHVKCLMLWPRAKHMSDICSHIVSRVYMHVCVSSL